MNAGIHAVKHNQEADDLAAADADLSFFFPEVDCGHIPLGTRVIVQLRGVMEKTKSGLVIVEETKETEKWNTQVAKVICVGALAFRNRKTAEKWPEGDWAMPGEYVRVPRWGGDRWEVQIPDRPKGDVALFVTFNDHELISKVTGDPRSVRAFII
jgi:co-chaperonin GroES (HSP10)